MAGRPSSYTPEVGEEICARMICGKNDQPVELYALSDPSTGEIRYIGKAINAKKRFKGHLRDARRRKTPVYCWIRKLIAQGTLPALRVLEVVPADQWGVAERRLINDHRRTGRLLNVADGGDEPFCPKEVRANNGRKNAKTRVSTPQKARFYQLKRDIGMGLKKGWTNEATRAKLRIMAIQYPHLFGEWANV